jgi:hypothetical protein
LSACCMAAPIILSSSISKTRMILSSLGGQGQTCPILVLQT